MATLGGIDIGKGLFKERQIGANRIQSIMERTRADTVLVWEQDSGPQAFDLVGTSNTGALKKSVLDQIEVLAETQGLITVLVYDNVSINVVFRHWEGEVIEASGLVPRELMTANDYYNNVRIKLLEAD